MKKLTTLVLCAVLLLMSAFTAMAIDLDVAEGAAENETAEAVLASDADIGIPLIDENYGKLILYKDFEQENAVPANVAYIDTSYMTDSSVTYAGITTAKIVDNPVTGVGGKVLSLAGDGWRQLFVTFGNFKVQEGCYRVIYDYYSAANCTNFMERCFTNIQHSGNDDGNKSDDVTAYPGIDTMNASAGTKWVTKAFSYALKATSLSDETGTGFNFGFTNNMRPYYNTADKVLQISQIGIMPSGADYSVDNIKMYFFPANAVIYKHNGVLKMVEYEDGYVTVPSISEVDSTWTLENFKVWTDGTVFFIPGKTYSYEDIAGRTLTPVAFVNELYDETKGDLVLLFDYEGKDSATDYTYVNSEYFADVTEMPYIRSDNLCTYSVITDKDGNKVVSVKTEKKGTNLFGYLWNGNIASAAELVTADFDYKIVNDISAFSGKSFWIRMCGESGENYINSGDINYTAALDTWTDVVVSRTYNKYTGTTGMLPQWNLDKTYDSEVYIDNFAVYVKPALVTFGETADGDVLDSVEFIGAATELTFPDPEDLEISTEDFICWTNGNEYYYPGETIAFTNASHPSKTSFYPFSQASDMPAVVSLYEGEEAMGVAKTVYVENIDDDGRSVLHAHQWKSSWTEGSYNKYMGDLRTSIKHTGFDASEYDVIEIMTKSPVAYNSVTPADKNTDYTAKTETSLVIYNYINSNYEYNADSIVDAFYYPIDDEYHLIQIDMKTKPNEKYPWESTGYGFAYDINTSTYGSDTYIDYVRVYRSGITTVTYDTNAPEGATVISEVDPDIGRGLGTGYLLKDLRPEVEGYVFKGWATSADSTETVTSIDLTGDTTVYAVWAEAEGYVAPEMLAETEIKGIGSNNGIRFKAEIKPSVKANLDEFGFIATREVLLPALDKEAGTYDYNALTFAHKVNGEQKNYYVQGIAYDADGNIDVINSNTQEGDIVYTAVLSGIPLENKNEVMVVRPYGKYEINGNEVTVYGTAVSGSLYETAKAIKDEGSEAYENNKTYIDSIVSEAE